MPPTEGPSNNGTRSRRTRCRGAELIEFTLLFIPMMAATCVIVDTAWAIWAKSTLQWAVKTGVRTGVTLTGTQVGSTGTLSGAVKTIVQTNAQGLLRGSTGLSLIKVHYYQSPDASSTGAATEVTGTAGADTPGNIMEVAVEGFSLVPLIPVILPKGAVDKSPLVFTVKAADLIEPSNDVAAP